jgi:hypothetical protein
VIEDVSFQSKLHSLKCLHSDLINFSFVTDYKIHIKNDRSKEGNRQGRAYCTEQRLTKLLVPTLLPARWLALQVNEKVELGKLQKKDGEDVIDGTLGRKLS